LDDLEDLLSVGVNVSVRQQSEEVNCLVVLDGSDNSLLPLLSLEEVSRLDALVNELSSLLKLLKFMFVM